MARRSYGYCPLKSQLQIALGVRPEIPVDLLCRRGVGTAGISLISDPGQLSSIDIDHPLEQDEDVIFWKFLKGPGDIVKRPPDGNDVYGMLAAQGETADGALETARRVAKKIKARMI